MTIGISTRFTNGGCLGMWGDVESGGEEWRAVAMQSI